MNITLDTETTKGQSVYNAVTRGCYDFFVLILSNNFFWECPTKNIIELFNKNLSTNHLDAGVGTGFFLDKTKANLNTNFTLLDLNEDSLQAAARRIKRFKPRIIKADILKPLPLGDEKFNSISINYLLHCIPGNFSEKAIAFDHLSVHLEKGGVIFGSTLLYAGEELNLAARLLAGFYNRKGIFHNLHDRYRDLREELENRFKDVKLKKIGCCALFVVSKPR